MEDTTKAQQQPTNSPARIVGGARHKDASKSQQQQPNSSIHDMESLKLKNIELEEENKMRAGPRELYDKLAGGSNYLPPMGFLETVDNSWDAKATNVNVRLTKDTSIQQDDGESFLKEYNNDDLSSEEINELKGIIKKKLAPLKELIRSDDNIGFNNWGLKGELAYHKSNANIYSWNEYWFIVIDINIQEQMEENTFNSGLNIEIYKKDQIPDKIRKQFHRRLINKDKKYQEKSGTLIYEVFTENKPNIIKDQESGHNDITQNHALWIKQWFRRRYFMKDTDKMLNFNGEQIKPLNIENAIPEDKRENRIKKHILKVYKGNGYLYFTIDDNFVKKIKKYNLKSKLNEDCKKQEWERFIKPQNIIGEVSITNIMCNKLNIGKDIHNLYNSDYEIPTKTKITLNGIMISEEKNYRTNEPHFNNIFTFIDIENTNGKKDLKILIIENCTITKQQGIANSIFYQPCYQIRKMVFSESSKYFSWDDQVKNTSKQDILKTPPESTPPPETATASETKPKRQKKKNNF